MNSLSVTHAALLSPSSSWMVLDQPHQENGSLVT
jgi:hypothetical protein